MCEYKHGHNSPYIGGEFRRLVKAHCLDIMTSDG